MSVVLLRSGIKQYWHIRENDSKTLSGIALRASYVLLHLADLLLTVIGVSLGFSELNAVMRSLLNAPLQLVIVKLAIPILIAWLVPSKFLIPAIVLISLVVCWDIKELLPLLV
ncbi:hypothetical protein ES703_59147 [subsurface metagenome]